MTIAAACRRCGFATIAVWMLAFPAHAQQPDATIVVRTSEELRLALAANLAVNNGARQILMLRGTYPVDAPISVPDGVSLSGEGVMRVDSSGVASGTEPGTETTLVASSRFDGDILTLGNGARVQGLVVRDMEVADGTQRNGNVVAVASRSARDVVVASIIECEIFSPNPPGFTQLGPTGRGIVAMVRDSAQESLPDEGASLRVNVARSVVHGRKTGVAVFVINFAGASATRIALSHSRIEGRFVATGGANRLHVVTHSVTEIESDHNVFAAPAESEPPGWMLFGGSSSPHIPTHESAGPGFNTLRMRSVSDLIEGFQVGVLAVAGRRVFANSGEASDNRVELDLTDLHIRTEGIGAADFSLFAALAEPDAQLGREFAIGDRNTLRARIVESHGSGQRANEYATHFGPLNAINFGSRNRIEFVGDLATFRTSNDHIEPEPSAQYFIGNAPAP